MVGITKKSKTNQFNFFKNWFKVANPGRNVASCKLAGLRNARERRSHKKPKNKNKNKQTKQNKTDGRKNQKNAWKKILRKRKEGIQNTDFVP